MPLGTGLVSHARIMMAYTNWASFGKPLGYGEIMKKVLPKLNVELLTSKYPNFRGM